MGVAQNKEQCDSFFIFPVFSRHYFTINIKVVFTLYFNVLYL